MITLQCDHHRRNRTGLTHEPYCCREGQAEALAELADAVMLWATTPGDHGGNPYAKEFVRLALQAKGGEL